MITKRRTVVAILAVALSAFTAGASYADEQADSAASRQLRSLKDYGATHDKCDGWTDGCALCARRADGSLGCSRMGVDCTIEAIQCTQPARDRKTGLTPAPQ